MDKRFHASAGPAPLAGAHLVRYADDFIILARYMGTGITNWVTATVEDWMGLTIYRDKTRIITLKKESASLDFLGYTFQYERDQYGRNKRFLNVVPSAKSCAREQEAIRGFINTRSSFVPIPELLKRTNRQLRGWSAYYNKGRGHTPLRAMNLFVFRRVVRHLKRRSQRPYRSPEAFRGMNMSRRNWD